MGRRNLAAWAISVGGDRVPVSARAATTGDLPLQACPDPGSGLSVLAAEHPPAAPSAHCPGVGGAVSGDRRDPARAAGPSLYGGGPECAGHWLLAQCWPACPRALSPSRSDQPPYHGAGVAPGTAPG